MDATWKNVDNRSSSGWSVIRVLFRARGCLGAFTELGLDNTRPDESKFQTENRIAKRFNVNRVDLVLEIL